jgi:hypothetical protein
VKTIWDFVPLGGISVFEFRVSARFHSTENAEAAHFEFETSQEPSPNWFQRSFST